MSSWTWTDSGVRAALDLPPRVPPGTGGPKFVAVSTDTRTLSPGSLFVALTGERFDGHDHLESAFRAGARGAVVDQDKDLSDPPDALELYRVPDTLVALGRLARSKRRSMSARVVGITGSSGKTTTKNLLTGAVASSLRTHATAGNLNNRVGLPLTLFEAPVDAQVLVLEMGTNEPGEIAALAAVAEPDIAVVTTVSETHLEGLGTMEGVLEEKVSLIEALPEEGVAFVGESPAGLADRARATGREVHVAGLSERAERELRPVGLALADNGRFRFEWRGNPVTLRIPGEGPLVDAMLALGVAETLGVPAGAAASGISAVEPGEMRGEVRSLLGRTLIVDCYNANPESVLDAARTLGSFRGERRVAVLGSMLELGERSGDLHARVLGQVLDLNLDRIAVLGEFTEAAAQIPDRRIVVLPGVDAAGDFLASGTRPGDVVLLKASRGVRLERALDGLASLTDGDA